ncbi:spore germination protein [Paenibacillus humicola]|uniref:spore germination protein n=1 Tax=Paenibacillus humicola TaxID=3110540 RepID=UPI00237B6DD7|nr:spore germination protein [Paenibacillus humicola]
MGAVFGFGYRKQPSGGGSSGTAGALPAKITIDAQIKDNLDYVRAIVGESPDITIREFEYGRSGKKIAVVYADGISDKKIVNEFILKPLAITNKQDDLDKMKPGEDLFDYIKTNGTAVGEIEVQAKWNKTILSILSGDTVIFVDGCEKAMICGSRGGKVRAISEANSQVVIRGSKEGFTETLGTNIAQVRRRIRSSNLWLETMQIGKVTHTDVAIMYINGLAKDEVVQEVISRLKKIETDSILESGYIEQLIQDSTYTPFPIMYNSERPDTVAGNLLEGRIAIFVDGTPFVLVAPASFVMFFQAAEDYYQNYQAASLIRLLRYGAYLISLFAPSIYIAAITFHQEMIPTQLVISLAAQRTNVPFPAFIEAAIMEISFEILREAGLRMPRAIGQAVSIVGALVLGQAAVEAGLISSAMVIVVAITGISSFATASYDLALSARIIRFALMVASAFLGFYGVAILSIIILAHLCALRSFGVPYLAPITPFKLNDQKDVLVRLPWRKLLSRPDIANSENQVRQEPSGKEPQ